MKTTIKQIHRHDAWFQFREQIEGRTAIIHRAARTEKMEAGYEFLTLTFDPPLSVNGRRMPEYMYLHCRHEPESNLHPVFADLLSSILGV